LTFYILGNSLTKTEVIEGLWSETAGEIIFQILRYVYLTLLIVQFILAMGNRPQGYLFILIHILLLLSF
jgi:chitin synthase